MTRRLPQSCAARLRENSAGAVLVFAKAGAETQR
jgi:hypothetical protein